MFDSTYGVKTKSTPKQRNEDQSLFQGRYSTKCGVPKGWSQERGSTSPGLKIPSLLSVVHKIMQTSLHMVSLPPSLLMFFFLTRYSGYCVLSASCSLNAFPALWLDSRYYKWISSFQETFTFLLSRQILFFLQKIQPITSFIKPSGAFPSSQSLPIRTSILPLIQAMRTF